MKKWYVQDTEYWYFAYVRIVDFNQVFLGEVWRDRDLSTKIYTKIKN